MSSDEFYQVNSANVMHEIINGEAVIVNLEKGSYYSLDNVGAYVWSRLINGIAIENIIKTLCARYTDHTVQLRNEIDQLMSLLIEEELITALPVSSNATAEPNVTTTDEVMLPKNYLALQLHKYSDMEDLLLLDPIHDVNETDWPRRD